MSRGEHGECTLGLINHVNLSVYGGDCPECTALFERDAVIEENNVLETLITEFLPSVLSDMENGLLLSVSHETCGCKDCLFFEWAFGIKRRLDAGEFNRFMEKM